MPCRAACGIVSVWPGAPASTAGNGVSDYRVIYEIHDDRLIVLVTRVRHQWYVYRKGRRSLGVIQPFRRSGRTTILATLVSEPQMNADQRRFRSVRLFFFNPCSSASIRG